MPCPKCLWQVTVPIPEGFVLPEGQPGQREQTRRDDPPAGGGDRSLKNQEDFVDPFGDLEVESLRALSGEVSTDRPQNVEDEDPADQFAAVPTFEPTQRSRIEKDRLQDAIDERLEAQAEGSTPVASQLPAAAQPVSKAQPKQRPRRSAASDSEGFVVRKPKTGFEEMDLTPMVDVTFLLLIFFMITASFSLQKAMEIPPPDPKQEGISQQPQTLEEMEETSILVDIDERNIVYVEEEPLRDLRDLAPRLEELIRNQQKNEVVITPDQAAMHETVVAVLDAANEAGMQRIRLASKTGEP